MALINLLCFYIYVYWCSICIIFVVYCYSFWITSSGNNGNIASLIYKMISFLFVFLLCLSLLLLSFLPHLASLLSIFTSDRKEAIRMSSQEDKQTVFPLNNNHLTDCQVHFYSTFPMYSPECLHSWFQTTQSVQMPLTQFESLHFEFKYV